MATRRIGFLPLIFAALLLIPGTVPATAADISFGIPGWSGNNPGVVSSAGGGAPLVGTNILVDSFTVSGTTFYFSALNGSPAYLNFTTGNFELDDGNYNWYWSGGGSISLDWPNYGNLFNGSFLTAKVSSFEGDLAYDLNATFADTKNGDFLALTGLPDVPYTGSMNLTWWGWLSPESGGGTYFIIPSSIANEPVPEPGTIALLGSGLVGLSAWGRKRFRKAP